MVHFVSTVVRWKRLLKFVLLRGLRCFTSLRLHFFHELVFCFATHMEKYFLNHIAATRQIVICIKPRCLGCCGAHRHIHLGHLLLIC